MNLRTIAAALGLTLLLTGSALAQGPGKQKGQKKNGAQRGAQIAQLDAPALDALVKLTPEQKTKITAIHDKFQADSKALPKDPSSRAKRRDLAQETTKQIMAVLTDEQKSKLQGTMREVGSLAGQGFPIPLLAELKLTDDQKKKIAEIVAESRKSAASGPVDRKALRKQAHDKIEALLTPEQKSIVTKYMAEHGKSRKKKKKA